ncbi:MAG: DUF2189 domain-containing protein [Rhodospirillaceae bacterium]
MSEDKLATPEGSMDAAAVDAPAKPVPAAMPGIEVNKIGTDAPWRWLQLGWKDLMATPFSSMTYGVIFAMIGMILLWGLSALKQPYLILPFTFGFFIIAPALATGVYELSRRLELEEFPTFGETVPSFLRNLTQILFGAGTVCLMLFGFVRLSILLFMLFFAAQPPALDQVVTSIFFTTTGWSFLATWLVLGGVWAFSIFAGAAIAFPMMLDRPQSTTIDGMVTSFRAVLRNPGPMLLWAALIVVMTFAGIMTLFIGLAVALPLIAHASWHAYRELTQGQE